MAPRHVSKADALKARRVLALRAGRPLFVDPGKPNCGFCRGKSKKLVTDEPFSLIAQPKSVGARKRALKPEWEDPMRRLITIAAAVVSLAGSTEIGGSAHAGAMPNTGVGVAANGTLQLEPLSAARVPAQEIAALGSLTETKPAELRIVSTEFRFSPATVLVAAGRVVTLVLDNSGAETEHCFFVPGLGFRLQAKAGEIVRKNILVEKPGKYDYNCDLPGHHDAGMAGTLIVVDR
jgi:uncharacterized cupredoxin-like copper-binding protein